MKGKRVLALLMAATIFFTNGELMYAANETENVESVNVIEEQEMLQEADIKEQGAALPEEADTQEDVPSCGTTTQDDWTYDIFQNEIRLTSYNGNDTNVIIPSEIDGKTVRILGTKLFYDKDKIETIYIPETITGMMDSSDTFLDASNLKAINVSEDSKKYFSREGVLFGYSGTDGSPIMKKYPEGKNESTYVIPNYVTFIPAATFYNCPNLKKIVVPESVDTIANVAFQYLKDVTIILKQNDTSKIDLGNHAFSNLTKSTIIVKNDEMQQWVIKQPNGKKPLHDCSEDTTVKIESKLTQQEKAAYLMPATSLTFDGKTTSDLLLERDESRELAYQIEPSNTTDTVTWSCDNDEIALLKTKNGKTTISALENGNCIITGTTDSGKQITLNVTVYTPLESVQLYYGGILNYERIETDYESFYEEIWFSIYPPEASCKDNVTWKSSNPEIISVKEKQKGWYNSSYRHWAELTLNKIGTATITATLKDGSNTITRSVTIAVTKDISQCEIVSVSDVTYTGKKAKPNVVIKDGDTTLKEGVDYTLECDDIDPTEYAVVHIYGIGNYTGYTGEYFKIRPASSVENPKEPSAENPKKQENLEIQKSQKITNVSSSYKKACKSTFTLKPKAKTSCSYKSSNKKVATVNSKGKVTIKGTGKATITITAKATSKYKKATKKVTIYAVPAKMKTPTVKAGSKKLTVKWEKDSKADGYQIQYSINKKFKKAKTVTISKKNTTKATIKKLKKGKKYYVRIRAYKKIDNKKYYGSYSKEKNVKVR